MEKKFYAIEGCIVDDTRTNIVQVKYVSNPRNDKRYTFKLPLDKKLFKGDLVRVCNQDGTERICTCVTNSVVVSDTVIDMIMEGKEVLSEVIGRYNLTPFST